MQAYIHTRERARDRRGRKSERQEKDKKERSKEYERKTGQGEGERQERDLEKERQGKGIGEKESDIARETESKTKHEPSRVCYDRDTVERVGTHEDLGEQATLLHLVSPQPPWELINNNNNNADIPSQNTADNRTSPRDKNNTTKNPECRSEVEQKLW